MQVQSLGQEDPLEEGMATHSNIFAWRIPWTEEPGGLKSIGLQKVINIEQLWKTMLNNIMIKEWVLPSMIRGKKQKQNRDICSWYFCSTLYWFSGTEIWQEREISHPDCKKKKYFNKTINYLYWQMT